MFPVLGAFLTPMSYQTNLLVLGPRHYKFRDYLRGVGLRTVLFLACMFTPSRTLVVWSIKDIRQILSHETILSAILDLFLSLSQFQLPVFAG